MISCEKMLNKIKRKIKKVLNIFFHTFYYHFKKLLKSLKNFRMSTGFINFLKNLFKIDSKKHHNYFPFLKIQI
jgi:hypothetical protein